ncbi:receptor-type tyrosine-protein phosphatase U [Sarotherodon galilaeus]
MMIAGFFFLIFFTGGNAFTVDLHDDQQMPNDTITMEKEENNNGNCGYNAVVKFLNLNKDNNNYTLTRPVKNYRTVTEVLHLMKVFGILDMKETEQIFISYIWVFLRWKNEHISWNPKEFCGLESITIPTELLWMPDLIIEEMTEKDKATTNPFLTIYSNGNVSFRNDHVVVSTCKMNVYKFPFDIQSCNLSFKSMTHTPREINLKTLENDKVITRWTKDLIETQDEWEFIDITVNNQTSDLDRFQSMLVYTITMKRRSVLYIANFILPILFFLILDLVSFLISDSGGEKLSFKVTVLLAVTVMQLILNDILPSSSDKVPLIALYCIGVFTLMMLSLLESILVMHLLDKDSATENNKTDGDQSLRMKKCCHCAPVYDASPDETESVTKEDSSSKLMEASLNLKQVSNEPEENGKTMNLLGSKRKDVKSGYWTRIVKKINKIFLIFYITTLTVFLGTMFSLWNSENY